MERDQTPVLKRCARCAAEFACGRTAIDGCWCERLPPLPARYRRDGADCLCPDCLRALLLQDRESHDAAGRAVAEGRC